MLCQAATSFEDASIMLWPHSLRCRLVTVRCSATFVWPKYFMSTFVRRVRTKNSKSYRTTQQPVLSPFSNVRRAARVAASNTSSTPSPLKLEHSRYLLAPISRATPSPSCVVTNRNDFLRISSIATGSSRRSFFNPTSMIGTPSQRRVASSIH